jgi:muramidase (phage lysozyme)
MSLSLDRCSALLPRLRPFLHVIREGETNQTDDAYRMVYGGKLVDGPEHPWYGRTTTEVGHSTAYGAYQFLGTSWKEASDALGIGNDTSPINQDLCAVWTIDQKRRATDAILAGDLERACEKLATEWVSLPGLGLARVQRVFQAYGGTLSPNAPETPGPTPQPTVATPGRAATSPEKPMLAALPLLQLFAPILSSMIPQIASLLKPQSEVAQRNVGIAQVVLDTITKATGQPNLQGAIEAMQADPEMKKTVQQAIVAEPELIGLMEIGGGIKEARAASLAMQNADKPFWYSPMFWISMAFFPMMYVIVGAVLFTVQPSEAIKDIPWWAQVGFDQATRSGLVNLIVGMVFGGVVGVWFGTSYGSMRKTELAATATEQAIAKP